MKTLIAIVFAFCFSGFAGAATLEDDVNQYVQALANGKSFDTYTVESLAWMGISDTRVFDLVERRALDSAEQGRTDRDVKDQVGFYIRALGFSGQTKYRPTLSEFASDYVYARYAKNALEVMPDYQKWNPVISNRASFDPKYSDEVNRILIMLRSDDFDLKKIGAKRVYAKNKDDVLLEALAEQIRATYATKDEQRSDSVAWMVKALGSAKQPQYRPLLEEVASYARNKTILRHAKLALER